MSTDVDHSCCSKLEPATLVELLRWRAIHNPDQLAYTFLGDVEAENVKLTYSELDQQARAIGALLRDMGASEERALLLYPPGLDYITAFFGCLYAGVIAVPAYPPRLNRNPLRLRTIAADAEATLALTTTPLLPRIGSLLAHAPELKSLRWLATDTISPHLAQQWSGVRASSDALAYLQYTSGSTAAPKGVMVSHENVLHNSAYIAYGLKYTPQSVALTWVPHFHDMGLVTGIVQPLYTGLHGLLMSPTAFLQRPARWLQAISTYGVTHSGGPNFAYDLCVRRISAEQRTTLNLKGWRVAFNGAEPVRQETLERFATCFEPCGFRRSAFYPGYGLAEATLKVSGVRKRNEPIYCTVRAEALEQNRVVEISESESNSRTLVGSGRAALGTNVIIVEPESGTQCAAGCVGEVWVSGPGVAKGYWKRVEETERTFRARLASGGGPYLRTGDLGFLQDGELFVTGRLKDLIIIRGRNHYPQDIERTVEGSHPALRPSAGAAFSVEVSGEERLVIAHEMEHRLHPNVKELIENIRQAIAEEHEIQVYAVVLLKAGSVPKTSSGKIQRHACRDKFGDGSLKVLAQWRANIEQEEEDLAAEVATFSHSAESLARWIQLQLAAKLKQDASQIDLDQPLSRYGLDSLLALELTHLIETGLKVSFPLVTFLQNLTIAQLADQALAQLTATAAQPKAVLNAVDEATAVHPLSRGQQALWLLQRLSPESAAYNIASAMRIKTGLDVSALRRSFQALIDRHASLRTVFPVLDGKPVQRVQERMKVCFEYQDASAWNEVDLKEGLVEEAHRSFDLERDSLLRVHLFRRSAEEHVMLLVAHHIVVDFWSLAVLLDELGVLYAADKQGAPAKLEPVTLQYTNYVRWQETVLSSAEGERRWSYWQKQLEGELPALNLATDHPRPPSQTYRGAAHSFRLNTERTSQLRALGQSRGMTPYMILLAIFQVLLHRYTGQDDILVGSPTAGRSRAKFAGLVGYFVNPVVLRADFSGNPSFDQFLDRVRQTVLKAFEHQDYPFAMLVQRLRPERTASHSPLFQVMFNFQKAPRLGEEGLTSFALGEAGARLKLGDLTLESIALEQRVAQFDLTLTVAEVDDEIAASLEYNADLFEEATIKGLAGHFQTLVDGIIAAPITRVSDLPLLNEAERKQLLTQWNETTTNYPSDRCLHELFEEQVRRHPEAIAVVFEDERLTYDELNRRANQLAHHLCRLGVGPEVRVGLCAGRSLALVVGVLGVLKAGGVYVPLEAEYPVTRLGFVIEDAQVQVLLTEARFINQLREHSARVVCLDTEWNAIAGEDEENPASYVKPDNLAYVIYTSGSTGRPKGVLVSHRSLVNHCVSIAHRYELRSHDRILQFASLSFDVAAEELFPSWLSGAAVILLPDQARASATDFSTFLHDEKVTVINLPASYWHRWITALSRSEASLPDALRLVVVGSEKCLPEDFITWQKLARNRIRWINAYGSTEATITSMIYEPGRFQVNDETNSVPIGRPINNTEVYLLDAHLQPVPIGVPAHIYLGGIALARGYLGQPALTAAQFVPHPFSQEGGARLYRTGDVGRYLADGNVEFVGRSDGQVKVRGYRVEVGEIEEALARHAGVRAATVGVEGDVGESRLVAYVVSHQQHLTTTELRNFLQKRLPQYMLPASFVFLNEMPLLPSGKVNRRALTALEHVHPEPTASFIAPRAEAEKILAEIWASVLAVERIGIDDNFFELGGDSILSLQVIARANKAGLHLTPQTLFERQTIRELAEAASSVTTVRAEQERVVGEARLSPIQRWFFEQQLSNARHYNQAIMLEAQTELEAAALERVVGCLLEHHDALRLRFTRNKAAGWRQIYAAVEENNVFSVIDLSQLANAQQAAAVELMSAQLQASLNLSQGPLVRVALFNLGRTKRQRLLLVIHHLAVDAVSWRILLEDMQTACQQLGRGEGVKLPPKTISYKEWSNRLAELARTQRLAQEELAYWLAEPRTRIARLPVDHESGENTEASAGSITVSLSAAETRSLLQEVHSAYRTQINDLLLTSLAEAFCRWTGQPSLLVDLEGHGREQITEELDLTRTVGWFTAINPMLLEMRETDAGAVLKSVKEQLRAVPRKGIGYGLLRYLSGDEEVRNRFAALPQAEVSFNYLGQLDRVFASEVFKFVREESAAARSRRNRRSYLIDVVAQVRGGELHVEWVYSQAVHERETIERVAKSYIRSLRKLIAHCLLPEAGSFTPSDFPEAELSQKDLDDLIAELD